MLFVSSLYLTSNQSFVSVYFAEHFFKQIEIIFVRSQKKYKEIDDTSN